MTQKKKRSRLYQSDGRPAEGDASREAAAQPSQAEHKTQNSLPAKEKATRRQNAMIVVKRYTVLGSGAGVIPIPGADMAGLSAVQYRMITRVATIYGVPVQEERLRGLISSLLAGLLSASLIYGPLTHMLGLATGIGWGLRSAVAVSVSAAATRALGIVFVRHFESGGTLLDFSADGKREELVRTFKDAMNEDVNDRKVAEEGAS